VAKSNDSKGRGASAAKADKGAKRRQSPKKTAKAAATNGSGRSNGAARYANGNGAAIVAAVEDVPARAENRRDWDAIRHAFETGAFPYKKKIKRAEYEERKAQLQVELLKAQKWVEETGQKVSCCSKAAMPPGRAAPSNGSWST